MKESTTNTTPPKSLEKKESSGSKQSSGRSSRGKDEEIPYFFDYKMEFFPSKTIPKI